MSAGTITHRVREPAGEAHGALVLLHGRGADEQDLAPLLDILDPERRLVGLLPRGPLSLPPGGAHWYVVRRIGFPDPATFLPTFERLSGWLDETLQDLRLGPDRVVLGGFSQGAVMSYALGLGAARPRPAGILAMSGFLPTVDGFELDPGSRAGMSVSISHGSFDPVIGVEWGREAKGRLEAAALDVRYREDPVDHRITPAAVAQAKAVLDETFTC